MAEEGIWKSVQNQGLLSTSALLDLYEVKREDRLAIESSHRPESITINHDVYGPAVIRDQKPMRESSLLKCLVGLSPMEWYELLNSKVFFWPTEERLLGLLKAREYRNRTHCIIEVDTGELVSRHIERIRLSPMNSGSTLYNPQPRGAHTFASLADYPFEERRKKRGLGNAVAELCVEYSVPDITEMVNRVTNMEGTRETEIIYER